MSIESNESTESSVELKLTPSELSDLKYGLDRFIGEYQGCYDKDSFDSMDRRFFRIKTLYRKIMKIKLKEEQ